MKLKDLKIDIEKDLIKPRKAVGRPTQKHADKRRKSRMDRKKWKKDIHD